MNKTASKEWLIISFHDLKSAEILYNANHYTDSIGSDLQQCIEKSMKAIIAYKNQKIPKTHDLYEIYSLIDELTFENNHIDLLYIATDYYKEERYPNPNYFLPTRKEIKKVLDFADSLLEKICAILKVDIDEIKK